MTLREQIESRLRAAGFDPDEEIPHRRVALLMGCEISEVPKMVATGELASLKLLDVTTASAMAQIAVTRAILRLGV